ncbi:MAG: radical SAM family heme chaperone HemW [Woeseiaceae bacterium]
MLPPLSLYIHLPWCVRKCPYCDFNSHRAGNQIQKKRYLVALEKDLQREAALSNGRVVETIFFGGGTPSLFTPDEIGAVLSACRNLLRLSDDCEITMEANPGTVERGALSAYRQAGITRVSLGAQSFDAEMLKVLGRIHGPDDIYGAYNEAAAAGFDSINVDLMFALPGQNLSAALADVDALLALESPHISYYQLTLEPNTVFFKRPPPNIPDDELAWEIQQACHAQLQQAGFKRYEISAFARPGHQCRHNLNYWSFGDYLAAGAGAHGKITRAGAAACRYQKPANPLLYMEWAEAEDASLAMTPIEENDKGFEFMLNKLRLSEGFTAAEFTSRTGQDFVVLQETLARAEADGLIERPEHDRWRPTQDGFRLLNDLQARFLA